MIKYSNKIYSLGQIVYLQTDPLQLEYHLIAVILMPAFKLDDPPTVQFVVRRDGIKYKVFDFEVSPTKGEVVQLPDDTE